MFQAGYRFPEKMTYQDLCAFVAKESNKAGFDPLRPRIHNNHRQLDYVTFYCVHKRHHPEQSRLAKGLPESTSKRPDRSEEERRCLYTSCNFEIRVRRSLEVELATDMSTDDLKEMKKSTKFDWYMDSPQDQSKESRYIKSSCHCFTHTGHPRRVHPLSDVTPDMRSRIVALAQNNVSVASIQTSILDEFKVMLSDFQVCFKFSCVVFPRFVNVESCLEF